MNYQIHYALLQTLELISLTLCAPHRVAAIRCEPRILDGAECTSWDIWVEPPARLIEAKLNPTKKDVLDWVRRVGAHTPADKATAHLLVLSRGSGRTLTALTQFIRIAKEAQAEPERFNVLLDLEDVECREEILSELGPEPLRALNQMEIINFPEPVLEEAIAFRARCLAGEEGGKRLEATLFQKLSVAGTNRARLNILDLITEISQSGIELQVPRPVQPTDLPAITLSALFTLQHCPAGVPLEVLANAHGTRPSELEAHLRPLLMSRLVVLHDGTCSLAPLPTSLKVPNPGDVLSATIRSLLAFIKQSGRTEASRRQIPNIVAISHECVTQRPDVVARVFMQLDKHLKDLGDKHLVLDMATLSVSAARRANPKTREEAEGEAHALICGISWVYQRIGRLREAQTYAEKSLRIGEEIGWDRNTAYCMKCIGRLHRLQAEAQNDEALRAIDIEQSCRYLKDAIERFSRASEFGPNDPEVGDCWSLLGRTYLLAGKTAEAEDAVRRAHDLVLVGDNKDYIDLLILDGDLQHEKGNFKIAGDFYRDALSRGTDAPSEISEIRARAYFRRGLNNVSLRRNELAQRDFASAKAIWQGLEEELGAAEAEWNEMLASRNLPAALQQQLISEPFAVRVKVVHLHTQRLSAARVAGPRKAEPPAGYWKSIIEQAREAAAIERKEW
jgi:tetratricopeptide (TPR) repeat protein